MTLIMACAAPEGLVLASDTLVTDNNGNKSWTAKKWAKLGRFNIGVSGNVGHVQAISFAAVDKQPHDLKDVISILRSSFKAAGVGPKVEVDGIERWNCWLIIACEKKIWMVDSMLAALPVKEGAWAVAGSAEDLATGALAAIEQVGNGLMATTAAAIVLNIAEEKNGFIGGKSIEVIPYTNESELPRYRAQGMLVPER